MKFTFLLFDFILCVYTVLGYLKRSEKNTGCSGTGDIDACELRCECLGLNLGPLKEQEVRSITVLLVKPGSSNSYVLMCEFSPILKINFADIN